MMPDFRHNIYPTMINYWSWWWEVDNAKDDVARTILTISVVILVVFWYKSMLEYTRKDAAPLPPGPRGLPIVGYIPFLDFNLHKTFTKMAHQYGPIFKLQLGSKLFVVVNSHELAKVVTCDQDQTFANRDPSQAGLAITYGGNEIVWSDNNTRWRNLRKILASQVLSNAHLRASQGLRKGEVQKTIKDVYAKIGREIDINEISFTTAYNVVTSMLWGRRAASDIGAEFREVQFKIVELVGAPNVSDFFPMLSRFDPQGVVRRTKRQLEHFDVIFERIIADKITSNTNQKESNGKKDFLDILLELKDQKDTPTSFNLTQIKALLVDILLAATDTTTTMMEWVMTEVLNNSGVMKKVQDEMIEVIGTNNCVEESHLPKLQYLDVVVKETLRLHPALPLLIPRRPNESCTVGGYTIPKGANVLLNVWAIHRDPKIWDNPSEFRPERFLKDDGSNKWDYNGKNLRFFPFGSGRRICPGLPLAEKMLMYQLASLLHLFEWRLPASEELDLSDNFGFVLKKRKPLIAIPSQRLSNADLYS